MHGRFARRFHQLTKQSLGKRLRFNHSLGMPLHAGYPVRITCPFDGFNHSIGCARSDTKTAPWFEYRLVVRSVHPHLIFPGQLGQTRPWLDSRHMKRLRRALLTTDPFVLDFSSDFVRYILNERSAQKNVQTLVAETNRQKPLVFVKSMLENIVVRLFSKTIRGSAFGAADRMKV